MSVVPLRQSNSFHNDPKFGRLLLASLIVHGLIWLAFSANWFGTSTRPKPPVYYVDLIHKPVLNPQAGRPDPRPAKKPQPVVKQAPQKVVPPPPKAVTEPEVKPLVKPTPKPEPKPEPKPVPKPAPTAKPAPVAKPEPIRKTEQKVQSALDEIRQRQAKQAEIDALKEKLARLREPVGAAAAVPADVPVGMPDGQGTDVGVAALAFVQAYIKQNWALSPYLLDQSRLGKIEARATLRYSASGELLHYRIDTPSGNQQFDDSLKRAITKSQQLPQPLPKDLELGVTFNLKDMVGRK